MLIPDSRWLYGGMAGGCFAMLGVALYMEHGMGLAPCPLCILQRGAALAVGVVALAAALHGPGVAGLRVYGALAGLAAAGGAALAGRQLWLQSLPDGQAPACGPGLDYLLEVLPLTQALMKALEGDGACAEVLWSFAGLSIPGWTFVGFAGLLALAVWQAWRPRAPGA